MVLLARCALASLIVLISFTALQASWVSDITGVNIDVPAGRATFGPPRPDRIPQMLQHLPQDAATFFLNPYAGTALATAIRAAKARARDNCQPIPPLVISRLSAFFPQDVFPGVCWTIVGNGFTLDSIAINDFGYAAITLEDVVVFDNYVAAQDPVLWSHELTHVLQYRRLGVEGFAAIYAGGADALEQEARKFDQFVAQRLASQNQQYYQTIPGWNPSATISHQQYSSAAREAHKPIGLHSVQPRSGFRRRCQQLPHPRLSHGLLSAEY